MFKIALFIFVGVPVSLLAAAVWSGWNETQLIEFCNGLSIGENQSVVLDKAKNLSGSQLNKFGSNQNSEQLLSNGIFYATCSMEFENSTLSKVQLGIS